MKLHNSPESSSMYTWQQKQFFVLRKLYDKYNDINIDKEIVSKKQMSNPKYGQHEIRDKFLKEGILYGVGYYFDSLQPVPLSSLVF